MTELHLGWTEQFARAFESQALPSDVPARVIAVHRNRIVVADAAGDRNVTLSRHLKDAESLERPATGDWVVVRAEQIVQVLPRRTAFVRQAAGTAAVPQVVAANVDRVFIVTALPDDVNPRRLERYLAVTWESGAIPVVVLTKTDLVENPDEWMTTVRHSAPGVDVIALSSVSGDGIEQLAALMAPGETIAFLGSSGVGKSTLLNRLAGRELMRTGEVRDDGRGRHTTTHRELVALPNGVLVIDTPGMRELQLWSAETGLDMAFDDVTSLAEQCRFGDCTHGAEPGCAVKIAIDEGVLDIERLESWRKLSREVARAERERDPVATAAHLATNKSIHRAMRVHQQTRRK